METTIKLDSAAMTAELFGLLDSNTIFGATFIKKNGETRSGRFRSSATMTKDKNGKGMSWDPRSRDMLTVWDMDKGAYRMINGRTLQRLSAEGKVYEVSE